MLAEPRLQDPIFLLKAGYFHHGLEVTSLVLHNLAVFSRDDGIVIFLKIVEGVVVGLNIVDDRLELLGLESHPDLLQFS